MAIKSDLKRYRTNFRAERLCDEGQQVQPPLVIRCVKLATRASQKS